jgi:hypothetical protein
VEQLYTSARIARLVLIPAINRLKHSWLKPASLVRCCYAMGVPTLSDRHVPKVVTFCRIVWRAGGEYPRRLAG